MRTEQISVFKFDELSESAKEKAREWYRNVSSSDDWYDSVYEDAKQVASLMGVTITEIGFSGFWSQGDGAHFEGSFKYAKGCAKAVAQYAPQDAELQRIAKEWQALQSTRFYKITGEVSHSGHYRHENCTSFGVSVDDNYADADTEESVKELMRDIMRWIYSQLEKEYYYLNADAQVDESIKMNDYEFTVDGEIF